MNKYEEMYNNICRICLSYMETEKKVCLSDNNSEDGLSSYGKAVTTFANISFSKENHLPRFMCFECLKLLKQAIRFKFKCENSEKQLLNWTDTYMKNGKSDTKIEEVIIQNIMFSHYFPEQTTENTIITKNQIPDLHITVHIEENYNNDHNFPEQEINEDSAHNMKYIDNSDELLNLMEKNINENSNMQTVNCKMYRPRKLLNRTLVPTKKLKRQHSMLQPRNSRHNSANKSNIEEKFICKICNKDLANQNTYRYHMQRHNGCSYICEHCGKGFPVFAELQLHQLARHDTGPYLQCKHCNYKAPRRHYLIEHERLHTGERPYTCDKCGLTFRRRAIWRKHMIYHTEKSVQCLHCPRKFFRRSEMEAHANSVHERRYVYLCHKCDTVYAKTATVRRHLIERHGIPREMQGKITRIDKARGVPSLLEQ